MAHNTGRDVYTTPDIRGPFTIERSAERSHDTPTPRRDLSELYALSKAAARHGAAALDTAESQRESQLDVATGRSVP